jgi:hypothetical protein
MTITFPNFPVEVLAEIADEVRNHGLDVVFESERCGRVTCDAGALDFVPTKMLIGGLRQLVEEGIERYHRKVTA